MKEGSALWTWGRKITAACATLGIDARSSLKHNERLRNRGFIEVNDVNLPCPLGPWAKGQRQKRLGWMARKDLYDGIDGISKKLFLMMGDTPEEVDDFNEKCKDELMDPAVCTPAKAFVYSYPSCLLTSPGRFIFACLCKFTVLRGSDDL